MIEVFIGSLRYSYDYVDKIVIREKGHRGGKPIDAYIILKVDVPPAAGQAVKIIADPNYFVGEVQSVRRVRKGAYGIVCIPKPKADDNDNIVELAEKFRF